MRCKSPCESTATGRDNKTTHYHKAAQSHRLMFGAIVCGELGSSGGVVVFEAVLCRQGLFVCDISRLGKCPSEKRAQTLPVEQEGTSCSLKTHTFSNGDSAQLGGESERGRVLINGTLCGEESLLTRWMSAVRQRVFQ